MRNSTTKAIDLEAMTARNRELIMALPAPAYETDEMMRQIRVALESWRARTAD